MTSCFAPEPCSDRLPPRRALRPPSAQPAPPPAAELRRPPTARPRLRHQAHPPGRPPAGCRLSARGRGRPAARPVALGHVRRRRPDRAGRDGRPGARLPADLDRVAGQDRAARPGAPAAGPRAGGDGRGQLAERGRRARRRDGRGRGGARARRRAGARRLGGRAGRQRQGTRRLASRAQRGGGGAPAAGRDRAARDRGLDRTLRRPVRHGLGDHERVRRHRRDPDHQPRRGGTGDRRGPARHRARARRRDPGGRVLQRLRARPAGYRANLRDAGAAIERLVGRDLDRSRLQRLRPAA